MFVVYGCGNDLGKKVNGFRSSLENYEIVIKILF